MKFFFRWYDFWIGGYYDTVNRFLYICPVPMFGIRIAIPGPKVMEYQEKIEVRDWNIEPLF
jgi:hypothetical protein